VSDIVRRCHLDVYCLLVSGVRCDESAGSRLGAAVVCDQIGAAFLKVGVSRREVMHLRKVQYAGSFFVPHTKTLATVMSLIAF